MEVLVGEHDAVGTFSVKGMESKRKCLLFRLCSPEDICRTAIAEGKLERTPDRFVGRRFGQLLIAVINLILWIPFVYVTVGILKNTVSDLSTMLMMAVASGSLPSIDLAASVWPLVGCFAGLYMPILPIRRWLTLAYAVCERKNASRKEAA